MSDITNDETVEDVGATADAYLKSHRKSASWRLIQTLRNEITRLQGRIADGIGVNQIQKDLRTRAEDKVQAVLDYLDGQPTTDLEVALRKILEGQAPQDEQ